MDGHRLECTYYLVQIRLKSGRDDNGEDNQTGNESYMGVKGADGSLRCDRLTSFAADAACIQDGVQ